MTNNATHLEKWTLYQRAWGAIGERERRHLLRESVSDDASYSDPTSQTEGVDQLVARIAESQRAFPGAFFRNDSLTDYNDQAMFEWTMYDADGAAIVRGASYARFDADGRLGRMSGFFKSPQDGSVLEQTVAARTWDIYQSAWARVSLDQRRTLLSTSVDAAAVYSDPAGVQERREELIAYIDAVQEKTPGIWFRQTLFIEHHDQAFSRWERLSPGDAVIRGASYARFSANGQLVQMSGFPGSEPSED